MVFRQAGGQLSAPNKIKTAVIAPNCGSGGGPAAQIQYQFHYCYGCSAAVVP